MACIDAELLSRLPLADVEKIVFYKRDELTTDLICCDVRVAGEVWTFHEALTGWELLIDHLHRLPGFEPAGLASIAQPPFEVSEAVAFWR
ncbi:hypothetical protein [Sphingopyxis sp. MSC1_008]|jgi:hypothetical protein|uniref:hypothetical protein n=1 Tax=Sphingopyxis sp. MSC1_008 TaxID=2909265 RepID=UPI0020C0C753|nr:hypothetical protein [Sphingopyxis sp. MSC1_008]